MKKKEKFVYEPVAGLTTDEAIKEAIQIAKKRGESITAVINDVNLSITGRSDAEKKKKEFLKKLEDSYTEKETKKKKRFVYEPVAGLTIIGAIREAVQIASKRGEPITAVMNDVRLTITEKSDTRKKLEEFHRKLIARYAREKSR